MMKRCDMIEDCDDGSDEKKCSNVELNPEKYRKDDPPFVDGKKTDVTMGRVFTSIFKQG